VRILVCVKRVPITGGRMVLRSDAQALETKHLGFTISPHEECAVEEAVRIVEAGGGEVVVLTLGPAEAEEQLRDCMAIGADRGILLKTDEEWDAQATAAAIVEAVRAEEPFDLLLFGNESADAGNYQVGIRVAYALGLPVVTGLKKIELADGRARVERDAGGARDVYEVALPAVLTALEGLNLPRYPSVPGRLRAKAKPLAVFEPPRPASKLEKLRLIVPEGQGKQAEILGHGVAAAPKVVEVMLQLGVA
jgi:electron transfer flavoprotein beta subunit